MRKEGLQVFPWSIDMGIADGLDSDEIDRLWCQYYLNLKDGVALLRKLEEMGGVDVQIPPGSGSTMLVVASGAGQTEVVGDLLVAGADPNLITPYGTALTHAVVNEKFEVVQRLVEFGADPLLKVNGFTAIDQAKDAGGEKMVEFLRGPKRG